MQKIDLVINHHNKNLSLCCKYTGEPITNDKELFKLSNKFFKTHANPFLLDIRQLWSTLELHGFFCQIDCKNANIINISNKKIHQGKSMKNNIIPFLTNVKNKK